MFPSLRFAICLLLSVQATAQISPFIHVDQFGYRTHAYKVAVISDPQVGFNQDLEYTPSSPLEVRTFFPDTLVMSVVPMLWKEGQTHAQSGDRGWWLDLSALQAEGRYYISDPAQSQESPSFIVSDNPYHDVLRTAGRMFYYNRCGTAKEAPFAEEGWTDEPSFLQDAQTRSLLDPNNPQAYKNLSGGWFDAGDYNKYVTFAYGPVHDLLWAWQENPTAFKDDWNIPESGNGIPDILDEVLWELDWLFKMSNPDGSVHIKMGSIEWSDNVFAPPSVNTQPRYYGPECTSAAIAMAGMLAHGAHVFEGQPGMSERVALWKERAEACFAWAAPQIVSGNADTDCDDGTIKAGDADWAEQDQLEAAFSAAVYLLQITGDTLYHTFIKTHLLIMRPIETGWWDSYLIPLTDALLLYTTFNQADSLMAVGIKQNLELAVLNNYGQFFGYTEDDLYRSHMPDWSYHWGSNLPKANYAILNLLVDRYNVAPYDSLALRYKAEDQIHYFHGVNPLGLVYLSNMYALGASRSVNEIYHTWFYDGTVWDHAHTSLYGPPPGYMSGGANQQYSNTEISPPYGQPQQKSYLDFNEGWPGNSWEITEPAIYYQSAYVRLLANYVHPEPTTSIGSLTVLRQPIPLFPNPLSAGSLVNLAQPMEEIGLVLDAYGRQVAQWPSGQSWLSTTQLPVGNYVVVWPAYVGRFMIGK